ncbi:protocadherin-15 precursor-like protein [Leptotrombidium deliense]|uniref:Protocadherin-15-like protein n=1 Tax=Leptotrombidium deliense TaxID=299467 RepID=A0A443SKX7_9ACAR|nr:protocadherin-15 precursor-like protein [Leptotrombidium deliense]
MSDKNELSSTDRLMKRNIKIQQLTFRSIIILVPVGTTIFRDIRAVDTDSGGNGLVEYYTQPIEGSPNDGYNYFEIKMPHQGLVTVKSALDYEKSRIHYLKIIATDKASDPKLRLSSTATLIVHIEDGDDLSPTFVYKDCPLINGYCLNVEYIANIASGSQPQTLRVLPERIKAIDKDSLNASIKYSFVEGTPTNFKQYFTIDALDGTVKQIRTVDRKNGKKYEIKVKAEQFENRKHFASSKLTINVMAVDKNAPMITPSSYHGYVQENAPIGSSVYENPNGESAVRILVSDKDIANDDTPAVYAFEVTTNAFRVNSDGYLVVNDPLLDRDPPNPQSYKFQIIAREIGSAEGKGASAPITMTIHLMDINDNAPKLPQMSAVQIEAGEGTRFVARLAAKDVDEIDKGRIVYSIHHVSNNGKEKFRINADTGEITTIGKLIAGQQYSITVQAMDTGNKVAQSILDVFVVPGPNRGGPTFVKERYEVDISEGISLQSSVITVLATDPENDSVKYSIIEGNINGDFEINSENGMITVANPLNREDVSAYHLIVKAEDKGGLYNTASVVITVTDINDENPRFLKENYVFKVDEEVANAYIGKVTARDLDIGDNGEVMYMISDDIHFQINEKTGEIYTKSALDYEKQTDYQLVVTAKDKAPNARLSTASVVVKVVDVQDEMPFFEKTSHTVYVPENSANTQLIQVKAIDLDTVQSITYMIREGDTSLFSIDSLTGIIRTNQGLDFERKNTHILIVGTIENNSNDEKASCAIRVTVQDQNDNAPIFNGIPIPVRLQDTVSLGTVVTTITATDADGTAPGNQIRYELIGKDKGVLYFMIDANTGLISVKDDLKREPDSEYKLIVKAKDLGTPSLSSTATITVFVDHITTVTPNSGIGFSESKYTVDVEENVLPDTAVKTISIINKPRGNFPMSCEIISGNEAKHFYILTNDQMDCELRVKEQKLDFERQSKYFLTIHLNTIGGLTGVSRLITQINVNIVDVNDNKPKFLIPQRYVNLTENRYATAVAIDAPADTQVIQVYAKDNDSLSNAVVIYELMKHTNSDGLFKIEPTTGVLRTSRPTENIPESDLPLKVTVIARDSPQMRSSSLFDSAEVIVNLIEDRHRVIIVFEETSTARVQEAKEQILQLLQERSGMIAGWEKAESLKMRRNTTIESDVTGTDVWIYFIEPRLLKILTTDDYRIKTTMFDPKAQNSVLTILKENLGYNVVRIRKPYAPQTITTSVVMSSPVATDVYDFGFALIALAALIAIFGVIGITYQCCMSPNRRLSNNKDQVKKVCVTSSTSTRHYDPLFVDSNMKQYETQVLQMNVPIDDDASVDDLMKGKQSLKGLMSVRGLISDLTFIPRSRAYNHSSNHSRFTASTSEKCSSSASPSHSCSSNSELQKTSNSSLISTEK